MDKFFASAAMKISWKNSILQKNNALTDIAKCDTFRA